MRSTFEHGLSNGRGITTGLSAAVLTATTGVKAVNKVSEGEMGVRTRFGRTHHKRGQKVGQPYGVKGPGMYPVFPFLHSVKVIHVRDRTNGLPEIQLNCEEKQIKIDSSVVWHVLPESDYPWRALFRAENLSELTQNVTGICVNGLRQVTSQMSRKELDDHRALFAGVEEVCKDDLLYYGTAIKRVNISAMTETIGEMIRQSGHPQSGVLGAVAVSGAVHQEMIPQQPDGPDLHIVG